VAVTASKPQRAERADSVRNRGRVLAAARKRMARDGLDAGMDQIAGEAGVGVGTVYRHFPTKDELVDALAAARFERLAELAREALQEPDAWRAFEGFMRASAKIQSDDRALSEVLVSRPDTMRAASEKYGVFELTAKLMKRAQDAGELRADAEPSDVPMLLCALAGTNRNPKMNPVRYIGIALDGLRAPGRSGLRS
jgi:AcrR family transcriptional regulator